MKTTSSFHFSKLVVRGGLSFRHKSEDISEGKSVQFLCQLGVKIDALVTDFGVKIAAQQTTNGIPHKSTCK